MLCDWSRKVTLRDLPRPAKRLVNGITAEMDFGALNVTGLTQELVQNCNAVVQLIRLIDESQ
jgi:hypothetical protein